jgi:Nucleotide-diphospho-sugar transferase
MPAPLDFVTFAADNYAGWIEYWLSSARRSNPESRLYVYDVSAKPSGTLAALVAQYPNAERIPWPEHSWQAPDWVADTDFRFFWPGFNLRDEIKYLARRLRFKLSAKKKHDWMIDKQAFVAGKRFFIRICCQKPYIIRDALSRTDRSLAYVDADAVVLERFPGYPADDSDFAVTVVDREQVRIGGQWEPLGPDGLLPVVLINAGVMFANQTEGARGLLDTWIDELSRVRHGGSDQTALANLIYRHDRHFHESRAPVRIVTRAGDAIVAGLPCARYNQVRIARDGSGIDSAAAIAHFVGSWKQPEHWDRVGEAIRQAWQRRGLAD